MKIAVGSTNPVKLRAAEEGFKDYYDDVIVEGFSVPSDVPDQPIGEDTFTGAENRVKNLMRRISGYDFYVGIEGGIISLHNTWFGFGAVCISNGKGYGYATSPMFPLPPEIVKELLEGTELGFVMDRILGERDVKKKGGAVGYFTYGKINRMDLYVPAIKLAIIPFLPRYSLKQQ